MLSRAGRVAAVCFALALSACQNRLDDDREQLAEARAEAAERVLAAEREALRTHALAEEAIAREKQRIAAHRAVARRQPTCQAPSPSWVSGLVELERGKRDTPGEPPTTDMISQLLSNSSPSQPFARGARQAISSRGER